MCRTNGGSSGGEWINITPKGQAGRGWLSGSMGGNRRNHTRTPTLERLVGHMAADVLHRRATVRDWIRYEFDLTAHAPDCRYVRAVRALNPWSIR